MITVAQLREIVPFCKRPDSIIDDLNEAMSAYEINTAVREAAFIAQVAHESGSFHYTQEIASGQSYEGRKDLGNDFPGDGPRFKGRGYIQITGRANYKACGDALGIDLIERPEELEKVANAAASAGWFWKTHGLNELADRGDMLTITKRINGGTNGLRERMAFYGLAQEVLQST